MTAAAGHSDPYEPGTTARGRRPEHFSTYVPRDLIRRLKVIAVLRDVPLWAIVTDALDQYLDRAEIDHGELSKLVQPRRGSRIEKE